MPSQNPLAVVLKGYPRLSETFIAQEIHNLEQAGFDITIFSLRQPTDKSRHPVHDAIQAEVNYLPEYLYQQPARLWRAWRIVRQLPGYKQARNQWFNDLLRDRSSNRIRRFGQAIVMAAELGEHIHKLYAHFLHTPASVTYYASLLTQKPWACSAHAKDIWTSPDWEIQEKLSHCQWLTTCTAYNVSHLQALASVSAHKVSLNYHGLDLQRFSAVSREYSSHDGDSGQNATLLLSVGRAVSKKGYVGLLHALAKLPAELHWTLNHIGGGPLLEQLQQLAQSLQISANINWHGSASQQAVIEAYQQADVFVLNSQIDADGDRDGLPNVLVEAQCTGLPVIATNLSGIPELVGDGRNGLLVEPGDTNALTAALQQLISQPLQRRALGECGQQTVLAEFDMHTNLKRLKTQLQEL